MTVKTICQECHTPNPPGSKFCSNCGARLPKSTSILCPRCQTPNPSSNFYCDKCGSRLIKEEAPQPSETPPEEDLPTSAKMFSLPTRKPGDTGELNADNVMEWLKSGQGQFEGSDQPETGKLPRLSDLTPEQRGKTADLPAWLLDSDNEEFLIEAPEDITTEHFLNMIQQIDDDERKKLSGMLSDPAITGKGGKLPDWLQDFVQSVEEEKPPASQPKAQPAPALPDYDEAENGNDLDWLTDLDSLDTDVLAQPVDSQSSTPGANISDDIPDWLDELEPPNTQMLSRPATLEDEVEDEEFLPDESVPDWLMAENLPNTDRLSEPRLGSAVGEASAEEEEYPDWLISPPDTSELELPAEPAPVDRFAAADAASQKSVTDWLVGFDDEDEEEGEEEIEDVYDLAVEDTAVSPAADETVHKSLTDWLKELDTGEPATEEPADNSELAAWLDAGDEEADTDFSETAKKETDWFASLESPSADEEAYEESLSFGQTGPLPDWLDELEPADEAQPPADQTFMSGMLDDLLGPSEPAETAASADTAVEEDDTFAEDDEFSEAVSPLNVNEEPDWLSELAAFDPNDLVTQETAVSPPPPDEGELFAAEPAAPEPEIAATAVAADEETDEEWADLDEILTGVDEEEEIADWLEQLSIPAEIPSDASLLQENETEKPLISTGELPEWIASMRPEETGQQDSLLPSVLPPEKEGLYDIADSLADADLPDWLQDTDVVQPEKTAVPLASAELPGWIDTDSEIGEPSSELESILAELPPALPPEEMLLKAEIPEWIQNLKPTALSGQPAANVDFRLETTGPLAGMPGVIKVEPIVAMPRSISPAAQFTITKEQQQQASLLRQLVQEEQQPLSSDQATTTPKGRQGLRFLLALLLLAAVGLALFAPGGLTGSQPASVPPAAAAMNAAINAAAGQPVLVAFEYTPAMAGELDHEARLLLSQLQDNGSQIITTSQSAAGTAVANSLTQSLTNPPIAIGMLAGEAIGLRQLANCVGDSSQLCRTLQGRGLDSNTQTALQNVALIIVLTGERASLINWVEQVGATAHTPLAAGVTQSLSPVAAPYYGSGQLQGYLDGLPAVVALSDAYGSSADMTQAKLQYGAQSLVQLAAALLLVVGALVMATTRKKPAA